MFEAIYWFGFTISLSLSLSEIILSTIKWLSPLNANLNQIGKSLHPFTGAIIVKKNRSIPRHIISFVWHLFVNILLSFLSWFNVCLIIVFKSHHYFHLPERIKKELSVLSASHLSFREVVICDLRGMTDTLTAEAIEERIAYYKRNVDL